MNNNEQPQKLNLQEVQQLLRDKMIEISPEDSRNPVHIAVDLGMLSLHEIERVETGYYNKVDAHKMLREGRILEPTAFGQRVLQAVMVNDGTIHTNG